MTRSSSGTVNAPVPQSSYPKTTTSAMAQHTQRSSGSTIRNNDEDDISMTNRGSFEAAEGTRDAMQDFAEKQRNLVQMIQRLEAFDIDNTLPSLPKIVVVGDQSHGKSSVVEALCDIQLPRDAGTCTRCPFEVVTSASDAVWTCKISLVQRFEHYGHGWKRMETTKITDFAFLDGKHGLENTLRLAQIAILSPNADPAAILRSGDIRRVPAESFSPNIIRLEVHSPTLPELSLFDLPGAINVTERPEDQHLVKFIEQLLAAYIKDEKALVLWTAAADTDVDLCKALQIIRDQGASDRCIGVITKPDKIDKGRNTLTKLHKIIVDNAWRIGHGWYVTKQLSQEEMERNITYAEARELETALFATEPWSSMPFRDHFGIENLQKALSHKLIQHIIDEWPIILARVQAKLKEVEDELKSYPEQSPVPCIEVVNEVEHLIHAINANLRGGFGQNKFRDDFKESTKELMESLKKARPEFHLATPGYVAPPLLVSDSDDDTPVASPTPQRRSGKSRKANNGRAIPTPSNNRSGTPSTSNRGKQIKKESGMTPEAFKVTFDLDRVRQIIDSGYNGGLPGGVASDMTERVSLDCLRGVQPIVATMLEKVQGQILALLRRCVDESLASRRATKLFSESKTIAEHKTYALFHAAADGVMDLVQCELYKPMVSDAEYYTAKKKDVATQLLQARAVHRVNEHFDMIDAGRLSGKLTGHKEREAKAKDPKFVETLGKDDYADMIGAMVVPLAYYDIATSRIADIVRLKLEHGVLYGLEQQLREHLRTELKTTNTEYCAALLAEDPAREQMRRRLIDERNRLQQALVELENCRSSVEM